MDRGSQLSQDDEDDEDDKDDKDDKEDVEVEVRRTRQEEAEEKEEATDIKSNNPHLAGGEKQRTFYYLSFWLGMQTAMFPEFSSGFLQPKPLHLQVSQDYLSFWLGQKGFPLN